MRTPAVANVLQQQARFDAFQACFNGERPHQALGMKVPGELYTPSPRPYRGCRRSTIPSTIGRPP
jgi:putative transposase